MVSDATGTAVLGVGVATLDVIYEVAEYPREDDKVRALTARRARGGNAANTLAVLRQLGHRCAWVGTWADDAAAAWVREDLDRRGIDSRAAVVHRGSTTPTSYILLSRARGTRTIVHYRDLPELQAEDFARVALDGWDWVHFEGRAPEHTARMIARVQRERPELPISLELEKLRPGSEQLLLPVRVLFLARSYLHACGAGDDPVPWLHRYRARSGAALALAPWGAEGVYAVTADEAPQFVPAHHPERVVDTLGAGDVFNAAVIDGLLRGWPTAQTLQRAVRLAGSKCGHLGLDVAEDWLQSSEN